VREPPIAPIFEASLVSANTSRKVSRATSTISASGVSFNALQEHSTHPQSVLHSDEVPASQNHNVQSTSFDRSSMGDWSALRPGSTQVTPFSLRSAHSSTPGTLEVNEATAISIYPHTNKSILVVQQLPRRDSEPIEHSAIVASNASFALPGPHVPALLHHAKTRNLLESPLKNPREPPQPPDFKVIPPTPIPNYSPTSDQDRDRNPAPTSSKTRFSRPLTIVKRALSARRHSDAIPSPLTRNLSRRRTSYAAPSDHDTKLHPFWRPRGFWDDIASDSDSDSEFGNDGPLVGNSLGLPAAHTVTQISAQPPRRAHSLSQRFSDSLRFSRRRSTSGVQRRQDDVYEHDADANRSYEFIQPEQASELMRGSTMPRLGYPVQFVGLKGLAERMEKRKERRREGKRERLREKLRGGGGVVPVMGAPKGWGGGGYLRGA